MLSMKSLLFAGPLLFSAINGQANPILLDSLQISDLKTRLEYARVLSYSKRYDESVREYKKIIEADPTLIEAQIELAKIYFYKHDDEKALEQINKIPEKEVSPELEVIKGDIFTAMKKYDQAEQIYKKLLQETPKDDQVKLKLAELFSWQKRYNDSLTLYEELVKSHPDDIQLRRKYGMVLLWAGKDKQAAEELKKTLSK